MVVEPFELSDSATVVFDYTLVWSSSETAAGLDRGSEPITNLTDPIVLNLPLLNNHSQPACSLECGAFVGESADTQTFSSQGCDLLFTSSGYASCQCTHLSSFAALLAPSGCSQLDWGWYHIASLSLICVAIASIILVILAIRYIPPIRKLAFGPEGNRIFEARVYQSVLEGTPQLERASFQASSVRHASQPAAQKPVFSGEYVDVELQVHRGIND